MKRLRAKSTESRWQWRMIGVDMDMRVENTDGDGEGNSSVAAKGPSFSKRDVAILWKAMEGGRRVTRTMQTQVRVSGEERPDCSLVHTESLRRSDGDAGELSFVRPCG